MLFNPHIYNPHHTLTLRCDGKLLYIKGYKAKKYTKLYRANEVKKELLRLCSINQIVNSNILKT